MAQRKILLDTNSYLRLAKNIHPLLDEVFGDENCCLYVLKEMESEWDHNSRLKKKFGWFYDDEYYENRQKKLTVSNRNKARIKDAEDYIWEYTLENPGPSEIDILHLAHGYVLGIPVVTDDGDMINTANMFGIEVYTSMELLKIMLDCGHIEYTLIHRIISHWVYEKDTPASFRSEHKRIFGFSPKV